ncbi:hypothetical protein BD413DRAFT_163406 [Trametes elegans]|nr:hypothetical protein BD413DRAFT_163406 [Trametes elegans]
MSLQDQVFEPAEIVDIYQTNFIQSGFVVAGATLLLYEWITTIDQEIKQFWNRRSTGASLLFLMIRYTALIANAFLNLVCFAQMADLVRHTPNDARFRGRAEHSAQSCAIVIRTQTVIQVVQFLPWAAFAALRVLALSKMRWALAVIVFVLSLGPPVINAMQFGYGLTGAEILMTGCSSEISESQQITIMSTVISRSTLIVADVIVICVTVWATRRNGRLTTRRRQLTMGSLADVLLCDGLLYFWTITCFNVVDLLLTLVSIVMPQYQTSYVTVLSDPMTAVLLCRFLLDLQTADQRSRGLGDTGSRDASVSDASANATGTLRFASLAIGSLGASLGGIASAAADIDGGGDADGYNGCVEPSPA